MSAAYHRLASLSPAHEATQRHDYETLSRLLSAASAAFDTDSAAAKACIEQAAELLIGPQEEKQPDNDRAAAPRGLAPWQQKRVAEYIAANIASSIRVEDMARVTGLSLGYFFGVFRHSFGESPLSYVARQRVVRSQMLMRKNSRASLAQIALECGMCDQAHFSRVFRRVVGMNPGVWRRQWACAV
jgi:AraC family transcriptional regulator